MRDVSDIFDNKDGLLGTQVTIRGILLVGVGVQDEEAPEGYFFESYLVPREGDSAQSFERVFEPEYQARHFVSIIDKHFFYRFHLKPRGPHGKRGPGSIMFGPYYLYANPAELTGMLVDDPSLPSNVLCLSDISLATVEVATDKFRRVTVDLRSAE